MADRVEFYWTHLRGIGTLENSLWAWDGAKIRVWLDALTIEKVRVDAKRDAYETVRESVSMPLDFYPLGPSLLPLSLSPHSLVHQRLMLKSNVRAAVLMDKGIIVGVDQETSLRRSLDFALFRIITTVRPLLAPLSHPPL